MLISYRRRLVAPAIGSHVVSRQIMVFRKGWLAVMGLVSSTVFLFGGLACAQNLRFVPPINTLTNLNNLLSSPNGLATDPEGNLYVADTSHSKIWKVDVTQTVTLYAGKGSGIYSGDNGPAIAAGLSAPLAVATDLAGNLFIADTSSYAIRRVDHATGIITTVAGGNGTGYTGDNGLATAAKLTYPTGVAIDPAGNIYIADGVAGVVRRVSTAGIITTYAGGGTPASGNGDGGPANSAKLMAPYGLALDSAGSLYIADQTAGLVRKVNSSGIISTFAGSTPGNSGQGGQATSAQLRGPRAIAIDASNNVFIADGNNALVSVVDSTGTINVLSGLGVYGTVGDGLPATEVTLAVPYGVAVDGTGNVFIASNTQNAVYRVVQHPERFPLTRVGSASATQRLILENVGASSLTPTSITFAGDFATTSNLGLNPRPCVANTAITTGFGNYCTFDVVFTPTASGIRTFPLTIVSNDSPSSQVLMLTSTGLSAAVATSGGEIFTVAGLFPGNQSNPGDNISALLASLNGIDGITTDSAGDIIFSEYGYCQIRKVNAVTGIISTIAGINPITCGTDNAANGVNGDGGPATQAKLYLPGPVVYGTDGTLYIADNGHYKIRSIDPQGIIHSVAGNGSNICAYTTDGNPALTTPICGASGLAIDGQNNLYYTDGANEAIFKVSAAGVLTRVAGVISIGSGSYSGDGGPALNAHLNNPYGIAVDKSGNIFFSDRSNYLIRRIDAVTGVITSIAGKVAVSGYAGDGGPATSATLNYIAGIALDNAGNLYLAESQSNAVRRIDATTGIITTFAGNYVVGGLYNGDGIPATDAGINYPETVTVDPGGYVLIGDRNRLIREVDPNGTINFGSQSLNTTSATKSVTVSNIGNMALHFDATTPYSVVGDFAYVSGGTCNFTQALAAGASCTVQLTFTPIAAYTRYGALALNDDGVASPQLVSLVGAGTPPVSAAQAVLTPATVPFGNQQAGTASSAQVVVVSNPGNATLNITSLALTGANPTAFAINSACGATLAANTSCNISVTFNPATGVTGALSAAITAADNAANSPQATILTGTSTAAPAPVATLTPPTLSFPNTAVGATSPSQTMTLTNSGNATLNIPGYQTNGGSFNVSTSTCGATLAAGASCTFSVVFVPQSTGPLTGNLTVSDNAAGAPQVTTFSGTATSAPAPQAVLAPISVTFANQISGTTSASQTVTLSNPGNATLNITSVSLGGANPSAFALTNVCGATLAAGASCPLTLTFTPSGVAAFGATINVVDNATGSPHSAAISGTGIAAPAPQAVLTPATLTFAGQISGTTSASQTVTLSNPGNATLNITGITLTGANPTAFALTNGCSATLAAGASCPVTVTLTPTSVTSFSAAISVADNAAGSPQSAAINGTGTAPPDFTTASPTPPQTVTAGSAATYQINVASLSGNFNLPVTLSASGLPAGATAVFTPPIVTPGSAGATSMLVIQTSATMAELRDGGQQQPRSPTHSNAGFELASSGIAMACLLFFRRMPRLANGRRLLLVVTGVLLMSLGMSGCGGGFLESTTASSFNITVTGTNGSDIHTTTISLTVR